MAGIYIHIPFCKKACTYCDFHFSTSANYHDRMVAAICKEIELRKSLIAKDAIATIYFGGGTPSLLSVSAIEKIMDIIKTNFQITENPEITLEANPDDLSKEKLQMLKSAGINRLSIGVQSFFDAHLLWMNRAHHAAESLQCIEDAQSLGFDNITIDLIYGIPQMTDAQWNENIETAIALGVPHISAYNLTVEKKTLLHHQISKGKTAGVTDEQGERNFQVLKELLTTNDYIQYEISNFGKQGYFSIHNSAYWKGETYLGVGPSAHSFDGKSRMWNVANNTKYMRGVEEQDLQLEAELLSPTDLINEHIMIGLRNMWGCNWKYLEQFGLDISDLRKKVGDYITTNDLEITTKGFKTSEKGLLFADAIATDLFLV